MKLRDLEIFVVAPPAPGWGGRYWIFTKVTTDNGIVGYGECYASTVGPKAMRAVIEDVFERHMMGESPENIELMYRRAYSAGFTQRPDPTVMGAFSGLEIACWDILGKARGRPVYALLGGKMNARVRSYTYLYPDEGDDAAEFWVNADMNARAAAKAVAHDAGRLWVGRERLLRHLHPVDLVAVAPEGDFRKVVEPVAGRVRAGDVGRRSMRVRVALRVGAREPLGICDRSLARGPLEQRAGLGLGCEGRRPGAVPADPRPVAVHEFAALRHGGRGARVPFYFTPGC